MEINAKHVSSNQIDAQINVFNIKYCQKTEISKLTAEQMLNIINDKMKLDVEFNTKMKDTALLDGDRKTIYVNSGIYNDTTKEAQLRMGIAKEIGHYLLHADIYKQLPFMGPDNRNKFEKALGGNLNVIESQARMFAEKALVPSRTIEKTINKMMENDEFKGKAISNEKAAWHDAALKIGHDLNVPVKVASDRMSHEGVDLEKKAFGRDKSNDHGMEMSMGR